MSGNTRQNPGFAFPFDDFQYVDVEFPTANVDVQIEHNLTVEDPADVGYVVVRQSAGTTIYDNLNHLFSDDTAPTLPWNRHLITLRSTGAPVKATLLLVAKRRYALPRA